MGNCKRIKQRARVILPSPFCTQKGEYFPLYHSLGILSRGNFTQKFSTIFPKFCANCQLCKPHLVCYNTNIENKGTDNKKKIKKVVDKSSKICYNKYIKKERNKKKEKMKKIENKHHNGWIDHRISYKIVFDTETCPLDRGMKEVSPWNMFTYDFGFAVVDKRGKVYEAFSFVNADIFCNEKELMKSAYYASKVPMYWDDIKAGRRTLTSFYNIWKIFNEVIAKYGVTEIYAHNARFDYGTLQNTQRWLTKSKYRYFFNPDIKICDTLKMAKDVMGNMPTYVKFCQENGYATKTGKPRFTAEVLYRFISGDNDFTESHTGLEDVMIEKEIMAYCYRQHKKMRKALWED